MSLLPAAQEIVTTLRDAGYQAVFVGGCVRDMIMGKDPADYDIATNATPDQVAQTFPRVVSVGAHFGVQLVLHREHKFEVATFRSDSSYSDGRHPDSVTFSTLEQDVKRRDFTINGLAFDPVDKRLFDFVGGEQDIKAKVVRTIGDPAMRFSEDRLRLMRAIRFAARLDFEIEKETFEQVKILSPQICVVSAERTREELGKIITAPGRGHGLRLLRETGLLRVILPEVDALYGVQQPERFHPEGDVFEHTVITLEHLNEPSLTLAFAALLHDVGKPGTQTHEDRIRFSGHDTKGAEMTEVICRRLKFSNVDREKIVQAVERHMKFIHVREMRLAKLKRFLCSSNFEEELELHRADCLASHGGLENWSFCFDKLRSLQKEELKPAPLLCGDDLISLGLVPGPQFKNILDAVRDKQLDGLLASKSEAVKFVKENYVDR